MTKWLLRTFKRLQQMIAVIKFIRLGIENRHLLTVICVKVWLGGGTVLFLPWLGFLYSFTGDYITLPCYELPEKLEERRRKPI